MTKALDLFQSLKPRLQAISVANGFLTDAGASVVEGPVPRRPGEPFPYVRIHEMDATVESTLPRSPAAKLRIQFLAEAFDEQPSAGDVMVTGHSLIADLKKALFGDAGMDLQGAALDARLEGYRIIPPPEGSSIVLAQVRGSYSFIDHFNAP